MGILDFLKASDINRLLMEYAADGPAVMLDVRTPQEFREGHIPGSRNLPLQNLDEVEEVAVRKDAPVYVYCQSGVRAGRAARMLRQMGYARVVNMGGIDDYTGNVEKGSGINGC